MYVLIVFDTYVYFDVITGNLTIRSLDFSVKLTIFAEETKRYLCFNHRWKLVASVSRHRHCYTVVRRLFRMNTRSDIGIIENVNDEKMKKAKEFLKSKDDLLSQI